MENIVQRSSKWFEQRRGLFTGSEFHKLLSGGRRDMTEEELKAYKKENPKGTRKTIDVEFGDTALSYIFEKAIEVVFGVNEDDNFDSFDTRRGKELEPYAIEQFRRNVEKDFISVEPCGFFTYGNNAGASPDSIVTDGNVKSVLECKCPRPTKFFKLVKEGKEAIDFEYQVQLQVEMLSTNTNKAYFFNFIIYNGQPMWHCIDIERDEEMIEIIKSKIDKAALIRNMYVQELNSKKQF
jgi:hypothetical protein